MNPKMLLGIGCALLFLLTPFVAAHLTSPTGSVSSGVLIGEPYRWHGTTPSSNSGVSGTYVGAAGVAIASKTVFPIHVDPFLSLCPWGYCTMVTGQCDFESLGDWGGFGADAVLDETVVDNSPTIGLVPDGTWDDGGQGSACHGTGLEPNSHNDRGCGGTSHGNDAIQGKTITIMPTCDDQSKVYDLTCFTDGIRDGNPTELANCVTFVVSEGFAFLTCVQSQACGTFTSCGADGTADETNIGSGDGVGGRGVNYPADIPACDSLAVATTYALTTVDADAKTVSPATSGWIDWTSSGGKSNSPPGPGTGVDTGISPCGISYALAVILDIISPGTC